MVNVAVSNRRAVVVDLVSNPRGAETFPCNISVPTSGGAVSERLYNLACRTDRLNLGIP